MPRGPGKKENYNLDYSRFSGTDDVDAEEAEERQLQQRMNDHARGTAGSGGSAPQVPSSPLQMPSTEEVQQAFARMPSEMREAYRLMGLSKENGDPEAETRATELALRAVQRGTPEVKEEFIATMAKQMPDVAERLRSELMSDDAASKDPSEILGAVSRCDKPVSADILQDKISSIKKDMEAGQAAAKKQMENLEKHQEKIESLRAPDDFFKFLQEGGFAEEDLQRMLSGDAAHMEKCMQNMLDGAAVQNSASTKEAEQALATAESLHKAVCGDGLADPDADGAPAAALAIADKPAKKTVVRKAPAEPEVQIPMHRLQYLKDDSGQYISVELKCTLQGVSNISGIALDVSEKHIRLSTCAPSPRYAVNAGPFPVLIDPARAKSKYSKRREELSISVPALNAAD